MPRERARAASSFAGMMSPTVLVRWVTDITFVRGVMAFVKAST